MLAEAGIIGLTLFLVLVILLLKVRIFQKSPPEKAYFYSLLYAVLIIGLFDHYPLTLQTGLLLSTISLSIL